MSWWRVQIVFATWTVTGALPELQGELLRPPKSSMGHCLVLEVQLGGLQCKPVGQDAGEDFTGSRGAKLQSSVCGAPVTTHQWDSNGSSAPSKNAMLPLAAAEYVCTSGC